jgi:hypothetical protein
MPFLVQACLDDHALAVATATAREAYAKAIEWHKIGRFTFISITDSTKTYSIDAFALAMALLEIAKTVTPLPSRRRKANVARGLWLTRAGGAKFEDPISLPSGRTLVTLRDAADYITKLPKKESDLPEWQTAIEVLILCSRGGHAMMARIGVMKALNRHVVQSRRQGAPLAQTKAVEIKTEEANPYLQRRRSAA